MAQLCTVIATSHSPFLFIDGSEWSRIRTLRDLPGRYDPAAPIDTDEENLAKHARCMAALDELQRQLTAARPDVVIVFGDDQDEQFSVANTPTLAVYAGESFGGYRVSKYAGVPLPNTPRVERPVDPENWGEVAGNPELAKHLLTGLVRAQFDPAFMLELPHPEVGMSHAFMRPLHCLRPALDLPVVPIFIDCFYGPQPTGRRCYDLGRAVRGLIDSWPADLRVAVIGSGGLWHTPLDANATIDERFNADILAAAVAGDAKAMADTFDEGLERCADYDAAQIESATGGTGMLVGYGSGIGETRNWVAAAAVAEGSTGVVVDSVPIWASPVGVAFAHWPQP